jgi:type II secretory ATPase GspE/PulE/Tfp pilus assembly ATPase PilB-like protein
MIASVMELGVAGGYVSPVKIAIMLVLSIPLYYAAPWVQRDARRIHAPDATCGATVLAVGALGLLIWLLLPFYLLGLLAYVVFLAAAMGTYVVYHNGKVDVEEDKLLTAHHLASVFGRSHSKDVAVMQRGRLYDANGRVVRPPDEEDPDSEKNAYNHTQELLYDLIYHRASDADVTPAGQQARVRLVVDGVMTEHEPLDLAVSEAIIQYLKSPTGMDPDEHRQPQTGKGAFDITGMGKPVDLELATAGTTGGQRMQFRMVQEAVRTNLDELGMAEDVLERVRKVNALPHGLIIVSGRARHGLTSTLYSMLRGHDAYMKQLATVESEPVVDLENVTQYRYGEDKNLPERLAAAARRDPNVLMVDKCPDPKTAELIARISEERLVLVGLHARDSFTALAKWIQAVGNKELALATLQGISCQVLLRKLCTECREAYRPDAQMLTRANISGEDVEVFYRKPTGPRVDEKGRPIVCQHCQETGYFGRTGAFEFMEITDAIRKLVLSGADVRQIKAACRKNGMLGLQDQALRKVIDGTTSIKEVIRVTQQDKKRKSQ